MKKFLTILVSTFALCSLISCTNNDETNNSDEVASSSEVGVRYKVTFLNYDDTFLYGILVLEGHEAKYGGVTPTKETNESPDYHYEFTGWDQDLSCITAELVTHAIFERVIDQQWSPIIFP